MSCEDIPSLLDLQNAKKNVDDLGRLMGTGEGDSTNEVTGQVRPTYNKVMKNLGFKPGSGDFTTGFTVIPGERDIAWYDPISGNWYSYLGIIPTGGHPVAPGTNPVGDSDWAPRTDQAEYTLLRNELAAPNGVDLVGGAAKESDLAALDLRVDYLEDIQGDTDKTAAQIARNLAAGSNTSISCYGDSTMWGATVGNLGVQDPNNEPAMLQLAISLVYNIATPVNNRAISGTTLRQMMAGTDGSGSTFKDKISAGGVDSGTEVIYCNHGINDSQLDGDINQYRLDLVEFVRLCRINGKVPVLATPNPNPPILIITEAKSKRLLNFVKVMRDVAGKMGVDIVDQYELITKSFGHYRPDEIVPDGAHLASFAYRQCGFNLAIPLVSCQTISNYGDFSTLTNTSYFDNFSTNRQIQTRTSRGGQLLTASRPSSGTQGVNYPVVFGKSVKCFSIWGLQWNDAANCIWTDNGLSNGSHYQQKQFGSQTYLDWDSDAKSYGRKMAGLHVIGLFFDMTTPGLGTGLTFGGVSLPAVTASSTNSAIAQPDPNTKSVVDAGDTLICRTVIGAGGVYFSDKGGNTVMVARISGGVFTVDLYKNGAVVQTGTVGTGLTEREYGLAIKSGNTSVDITIDALTVSIPVTTKLPNMKPYTSFIRYLITPTFGI